MAEETRKKISETRKRLYREGRIIPAKFMLGKHHTEETKRKISLANKGRLSPMLGKKHTIKTKQKMSIIAKGKPSWSKGKHLSEKHKEKLSLMQKSLWKDTEYREKSIKRLLQKSNKKPTSLERQMIGIIQRNNLPYRYVGNGEFILDGKNPDFINTNGEKICIEVRSIGVCKYRHKISPEEYIRQRQEHFAKYGWKCVVFVADRKLEKKDILKEFHSF